MAKVTDVTPSYYGEPRKFDPNFKGPVHNRSCTDVVCCFIFLSVILGYIALGTVAAIHGDPKKLVYATDSRGQFCGQKGTPTERKNVLFYFNLLKCNSPSTLINLQCPTTQVCVSKCPNQFATLKTALNTDKWEYYKQFCKPDFEFGQKTAEEILKEEGCPALIVPSKPFFQRCFPDFTLTNGKLTVASVTNIQDDANGTSAEVFKKAAKELSSLLKIKNVGMKVFEDYANSWDLILIGLLVTLAASLFFIIFLRYTAVILLSLVVMSILTVIAYAIYLCYHRYAHLVNPANEVNDSSLQEIGLQTDLSIYLGSSDTWLVFLVILCVVKAIILSMLLFLRKRLFISVTLMKEASKAISYIMSTLFYPIVTFFLVSVCIAFWLATTVFLASSGHAVFKVSSPNDDCKHDDETCDPKTFKKLPECPEAQCLFSFYGGETTYYKAISLLHLCNLFVFLWLINFVIALGQCCMAGAFASYYWALRKPEDIPIYPLLSSFNRSLRYHTGSIAFGTLVVLMVQWFRHFLEYIYSKLKGSRNPLGRCLFCSFKCCFWALENFIKYINRNAYIMIAIYGRNFHNSAKDAYFLLMRNIIRVSVLDKVTDFLLFLGKIVISGGVGALGFYLLSTHIPIIQEEVPSFNYFWVPIATLILGAYLISHGFFNIYSICVDTLFLCFLCDIEMNDGSLDRPYYTNIMLRKILLKNVNIDSRL